MQKYHTVTVFIFYNIIPYTSLARGALHNIRSLLSQRPVEVKCFCHEGGMWFFFFKWLYLIIKITIDAIYISYNFEKKVTRGTFPLTALPVG